MKYILVFLISLVSFFCNATGLHQTRGKDTVEVRFDKKYFLSYLTDARDIYTAPAHWNKKQWISAGTVLGTTAILITQDAKIQEFAMNNRTDFLDNVEKYGFERWGGSKVYTNYSLITMGVFYLHGELFDNQRSKRVALLGLKTFVVTGAILYIPKFMFGRHRPFADDPSDPYAWDGPFSGHYSLPSGHTTSVFAIASIVASEYKDNPIVPVVAYSIATLTSISRVYENKHWGSDVLIGAVFGYAMGKLIYNKNNWGIHIKPATTPEVTGVTLIFPIP